MGEHSNSIVFYCLYRICTISNLQVDFVCSKEITKITLFDQRSVARLNSYKINLLDNKRPILR
ncbi:hypothetical protein D3C76_378880 [compost metagenome]